MTVITLSTVGFGEVAPMTPTAKIFTVFFIMISLTVFAFGIKELTQFVLTENIFEKINKNKLCQDADARVTNHHHHLFNSLKIQTKQLQMWLKKLLRNTTNKQKSK